MNNVAVYAVDVGSIPNGNFGWSCGALPEREVPLSGGVTIEGVKDRLLQDLEAGRPVALGFECPLFFPTGRRTKDLCAQREGEKGSPWSAAAGATSLTSGLAQARWLFREIHAGLRPLPPVSFSWSRFAEKGGLFIWEAFITGTGKAGEKEGHQEDAETAVRAFLRALPDPTGSNAVNEQQVFSLVGALLLETGWSTDLALLQEPALVIRPEIGLAV